MQYTQVNIGRNINGIPMKKKTWVAYVQEIAKLMHETHSGDKQVEIHFGYGQWRNNAGELEEEESAHVSVHSFSGRLNHGLKMMLASYARNYDQEAIVLITEQGVEFIAPQEG